MTVDEALKVSRRARISDPRPTRWRRAAITLRDAEYALRLSPFVPAKRRTLAAMIAKANRLCKMADAVDPTENMDDATDSEKPPREYHVVWEIDLDAKSPVHAARYALDIMRDPESMATVFTVRDHETGGVAHVDLGQGWPTKGGRS